MCNPEPLISRKWLVSLLAFENMRRGWWCLVDDFIWKRRITGNEQKASRSEVHLYSIRTWKCEAQIPTEIAKIVRLDFSASCLNLYSPIMFLPSNNGQCSIQLLKSLW
jgi:hypothetical protein